MADKRISELTELLAAGTANDDVLPIVDTSASETKKIAISQLSTLFSSNIPNGDKGDITVSSSGAVWTIDNNAVTYSKIQNVSATDRLLGRFSSGAGVIEEITCTSAGRALLNAADNAAQRTTLGATTIGANVFTLTNPSAITFPRFNADNTISALSASDFRTAIGVGTGTGSVTSVSWTGGIVSIANSTTTPAFTIAGTSGGIPYFSSGTTWATSAALAANALVVGGGAGNAPSTITTGSGVVTALGISANGSGGFVTDSGTVTLTNKRVNPRSVVASATSGNLTINGDTTDLYEAESLTGAITFLQPSGTPVDGQKLMIRIKDNGTARGITWTTSAGAFRAIGVTLPTTTVLSKVTYVGCFYNSTDSFWDVVAVTTQA